MIKKSAQRFSTTNWKKSEISMRLSDLYDNFYQDDTGIDIR